MGKISLIIKREYWTRVRKKSFIVMTILGPIIMAAMMIVPIWFAQNSSEEKTILVFDESNLFQNQLQSTEKIKFRYSTSSYNSKKKSLDQLNFDGYLIIPSLNLKDPKGISFLSEKTISLGTKTVIEAEISKIIIDKKYKIAGLDKKLIDNLKTNISIKTINISGDSEEETSSVAKTIAGFLGAIMIYMFIFIYGAQVMRGVIEEKTSRVIEVIISSVKPFQLMMGKVIGIALVGLTQFVFWITSSIALMSVVSVVFGFNQVTDAKLQQTLINTPRTDFDKVLMKHDILVAFNSLDFPLLIGAFLFFFLAGYLFYGALFAAIGAAVDSESDTQQFMLPLTAPLILAFSVVQGIMENPDSSTAFWFSIVPFTSPIVMMIRLPFIGYSWELFLSMFLLVVGFISTIWIAGKIYRIGILMHGKKVSYKELSKWIFYKI